MERGQAARRAAVLGLVLVLLTLTAVSVVGAAETRRSANAVSNSTRIADAFNRAKAAVAREELSEQHYRLEPDQETRSQHREASAALEDALTDVQRWGSTHDRDVADQALRLHVGYLAAIRALFDAVDAHDQATVVRIDSEDADPTFEQITDLVETASANHSREAADAIQRLHRTEGLVFTATAAGFGVGLALLAAFAVAALGYQRGLLRQAAENEYQAQHDALTGLPNRQFFTERITEVLASGGKAAVFILDLDRFKEVNDTLGHQYGDELLKQVAARTSTMVRAGSGDIVARLSGDEFAVLLPGATEKSAVEIAERLLGMLHQTFNLGDVSVDVEASLGIAIAPVHADTATALMRCADVALYSAKDAKTGAVLYRPTMHTEDTSRLLMLGDLRRALDTSDQLQLYYQPKVGLGTGELDGVEALVRWQHPTRGMINPGDFIPMAETTGLITRLTLHVLRLAVVQARTWLDDGLTVPIAVNLSPRCLLDPHLVGHVTGLLDEYKLPSALLRLEVTETAVMANPALATATLTELHDLGIRLSIDDYGTGYSSMAYLKSLPVDELKVDRTFVLDMDRDQEDAVLVRGAIELGHNLGMTVVAEGVEGAAHVDALRALGCDIAQGYHYARPMPAADLKQWIAAQQVTVPSGMQASATT
jgi:diguanylate cyclase (GGDEF)-like protein